MNAEHLTKGETGPDEKTEMGKSIAELSSSCEALESSSFKQTLIKIYAYSSFWPSDHQNKFSFEHLNMWPMPRWHSKEYASLGGPIICFQLPLLITDCLRAGASNLCQWSKSSLRSCLIQPTDIALWRHSAIGRSSNSGWVLEPTHPPLTQTGSHQPAA